MPTLIAAGIVRSGSPSARSSRVSQPGVHALERHEPEGVGGEVRRGVAQGAAPVVAVDDGADDPVRPAEDAGRLGDLAGPQVPADDGRGEPLPLADVVERDDLEPELLAEVGQGRDVAGVAVPEAGVHADDDAAGVQPPHEDGPDEVLGRLLGELAW